MNKYSLKQLRLIAKINCNMNHSTGLCAMRCIDLSNGFFDSLREKMHEKYFKDNF